MGKAIDNEILPLTFGNYHFSKYMKFNERVFIYNFPFKENKINYSKIFAKLFVLNFFQTKDGIIMARNENEVIFVILVIIILQFLLYMLYLCLNCIQNNKKSRLDIVYSNNFDKIFIGLVKKNQKSYINKFTFNIDSIQQFILESYKNSNEKFYLKVIMKNQQIQNICRIDENKTNLEGLLFILNKRLININII